MYGVEIREERKKEEDEQRGVGEGRTGAISQGKMVIAISLDY